MKKLLSIILLGASIFGLTSCDNETTSVVSSGSTPDVISETILSEDILTETIISEVTVEEDQPSKTVVKDASNLNIQYMDSNFKSNWHKFYVIKITILKTLACYFESAEYTHLLVYSNDERFNVGDNYFTVYSGYSIDDVEIKAKDIVNKMFSDEESAYKYASDLNNKLVENN